MRCLPYGPDAWLVDEVAEPINWAEGVRQAVIFGVREVLPAEESVLIVCEPSRLDEVRTRLESVRSSPIIGPSNVVLVDVAYGGVGLQTVAQLAGLTSSDVVFRHASCSYSAAFCSSAPGFASLSGLDASLRLPRPHGHSESVPAGSIVIGGPYTGVSPTSLRSNWYVIGSTDTQVWNQNRGQPAMITPGTVVRFRSG